MAGIDTTGKYLDPSAYAPFTKENGLSCENGLIAVPDACGGIACLLPPDAEQYTISQIKPSEGSVKVYDQINGEFVGCMTVEESVTYYASRPAPAP